MFWGEGGSGGWGWGSWTGGAVYGTRVVCDIPMPHFLRDAFWLWGEQAGEAAGELSGVLGFAFPDGEDAPAETLERAFVFGVAGGVAGEFGGPEVAVGGGKTAGAAVGVLMPEAAVDKKHGAARSENEVGFSGEVAALQPVAEAEGSHELTDHFFRFGIMAADARHVPRALFRR